MKKSLLYFIKINAEVDELEQILHKKAHKTILS